MEARTGELLDSKVNVRTTLGALWICHFILWIFGDMFTLLQDVAEPVTDTFVTYVAPSTAIVLVLLVAYTLVGDATRVRWAHLMLAPVYFLLNVGFFIDATEGWEYYIGVFYVLFNVLVFWQAYTWPREG
jgi:hypothetical protein